MNENNRPNRDEELVHAYYDGELQGFARRRFEQRLRRSPDLQAELRPALLRIGDRIADLLVALPEGLSEAHVARVTRDGLRARQPCFFMTSARKSMKARVFGGTADPA